MKVWANGQIVDEKAAINSFNYSLHYASPAAWEGIRSYLKLDGSTLIFKLKDHIARLYESAQIEGFTIPWRPEQLEQACIDVVAANGGGNLYLRPIAYCANDAESIRSSSEDIRVDIYVVPAESKLGKEVRVAISGIVRGYPQFQMQAKTSANYKFIQTVKKELEHRDVDDLLIVDNQGYITEATVANIFVKKGKKIWTPPNDGSILPGITRQWVGNSVRGVEERKVTRADLYTADCVFLTGTYSELMLVTEIDGRRVDRNTALFTFLKEKFRRETIE